MTQDARAGQELAALRQRTPAPHNGRPRRHPYLTQREVAEAAAIDRSRYIALEKGRERLTPYYAEKLAAVLGDDVWNLVNPRGTELSGSTWGPPKRLLDRLESLEGEVAAIQTARDAALREVVARLAVLEERLERVERRSARPSSEGSAR